MHRLAMVRGLVGGVYPTSFVVDTGGEVISISQTTAAALNPTLAGGSGKGKPLSLPHLGSGSRKHFQCGVMNLLSGFGANPRR